MKSFFNIAFIGFLFFFATTPSKAGCISKTPTNNGNYYYKDVYCLSVNGSRADSVTVAPGLPANVAVTDNMFTLDCAGCQWVDKGYIAEGRVSLSVDGDSPFWAPIVKPGDVSIALQGLALGTHKVVMNPGLPTWSLTTTVTVKAEQTWLPGIISLILLD